MPNPPRMTDLVPPKGRYAKPKRGSKSFFQENRRASGNPALLAGRKGVHGIPPNAAGAGQALMESRNAGAVIFSACGSDGIITRPVRGTERSKLVMLKPSSLNGG